MSYSCRPPARFHSDRVVGRHRVISILIGLLPAVQKSAGRRMSCSNNLKQLGLGFLASTNRTVSSNIRPDAISTVRVRWLTYLLPYIEQDNLYRNANLNINWHQPANLPIFGSRIKILECPSAPNGQVLDGAPDTTPAWTQIVANGDYSGFYGVDPQLVTLGLVDASSGRVDNGAISKITKLHFNHFSDGLSNTLHLTESAGRPNVYRNGKFVISASGNSRVNGGGWCRPATELNLLRGSSPDGTTFPGPSAINVTNGEVLGTYPHPFYNVDGTGQIYGFHSGGVNALFGDGSVRFIRQNINIRTLAALVTRNGGETLVTFD